MAVSMNTWLNQQQAYFNSGVREMAQVRDFAATQKQTQSIAETFKKNNDTVRTLQKESNAFLQDYSAGMNNQSQTASRLSGDAINNVLKDGDGNVTETTVKNTVNTVRDMVNQYNDNIATLDQNVDRGPGVREQLARMVADPASAEDMANAGVSVNDDGTLSLNEEALTQALMNADTRDATVQSISGQGGLAEGIRQDAQDGLRTSSSELVQNDVTRAQTIREEDPIRRMAADIRGMGGGAMNNYFMAMSGSLMNMLV